MCFLIWTHGTCRYGNFESLIFRQSYEFGHLRSCFSSKGHTWTVQVIFSTKKSIHRPFGPHLSSRKSIYGLFGSHISRRKPIYGPYRPYISCRKSLYEFSVSPLLERVLIYGPPISPFLCTLLAGQTLFHFCSETILY